MKKGKPQEKDVLKQIPRTHSITRRAIIISLMDDFDYFSTSLIDVHLRSLEQQGKIKRVGTGEYQQHHDL
jgi:hypothetical protein